MSELEVPDGWEIKTLEQIVEKISNGTNEKQISQSVGLPVTRIETISFSKVDLNRVKYIEKPSDELIEKYQLHKGDILFSHINSDIHLGKTALFDLNEVVLHGVNLLLIRPNQNIILSTYLNYFFNFLRLSHYFESLGHKSVNQSSINQAKLKNIEILIPSISTQKKIVQKLNHILGQLKEREKEILELQSIKLKNSKYLSNNFMNYIISEFIPIENYPTTWKSVTLADIFLIINQKWQPNSKSTSLNYIGLENIESNTGKLVNFSPTNSLKIKSSKTCFLKKHVLYGKLRPYLNKILLPNFDGVCSTDILVLEPKPIVLKEFLAYFLRSSNVLSPMTQLMYGTKMPRAKIQDLEKIRLGLPPKEEQKTIISEIQRAENHINTIKESIMTSVEQQEKISEYLKYLHSSILDKAFSGELVN